MSLISFLILAPALLLADAGTSVPGGGSPVPDSVVARASDRSGGDSLAAESDSLHLSLRLRMVGVPASAGSGRVVEPAGVAADAFGRLYVTDAGSHRLVRYDARGAWLGEAGTLGSGAGQMRRPGAVTPLGTLGIAVLDRENRRVLSYDLFGRLLGTLIDLVAPELEDQLDRVDPVDLAADVGGAVYVADAERDRLLVFDFAGRYVRTVGGYGAKPGSFRGLTGVAAGRRGQMVTTERGNARVQTLDAGGRVLAAWPLHVRPGAGALPVAVDDSSRVAVADERTGRLWVFDSAGRPLAAARGLRGPRGLAFARDGALLVAESGAGLVRRFVLEPDPRAPAARGE